MLTLVDPKTSPKTNGEAVFDALLVDARPDSSNSPEVSGPVASASGTRIVILGAGYGGITCALRLARKLDPDLAAGEAQIILVDRNPYHLLETRLHEAAARGVEVTIPIAKLLRHRRIRFLQAVVEGLDVHEKRVGSSIGPIPYDRLVLALGSKSADFGIPGISKHAFGLKTLEDARSLKAHMEKRFAQAAGEEDPGRRRWLRRVVVGGAGLTGVEVATELAGRARDLAGRRLNDPEGPEILLIEATERILPSRDAKVVKRVQGILHGAGIRVLTGTRITSVDETKLHLSTGEVVRAGTIVWTAGVRGSDVLERSDLETSRQGRVLVDGTLRAEGRTDIYVLGDLALATHPDTGEPVPMAAQFALQQGRLAADNLVAELCGGEGSVYQPRVLGEVIGLGRHLATGWLALGWAGRLRMTGFLASLLRRAIREKHLLSLWRESHRLARPGD